MTPKHTVRIRKDWLTHRVEESGGVRKFAESTGIGPSTISRSMRQEMEASPILIGGVLAKYPIEFHDAFEVIDVDEMDKARSMNLSDRAGEKGKDSVKTTGDQQKKAIRGRNPDP